jgi:hypothetical protein
VWDRRWEVYHGQLSENGSKWDGSTNPRKPGSYSLENLRFVITDKVITTLQQPPTANDAHHVHAMKVLAWILSPNRCGIFDELMALIQTNVITVQPNGIPTLAKTWWSSIDILLLDDMWNHWGMQKDNLGNFGICPKVRNMIHRKWSRSKDGWALSPRNNVTIYEFDEFDEWRLAYEAKQQTTSDGVHGIGRFR